MTAGKRSGGGPKALAATLARITKPLFGRRGFAEASILNDWPAVIGPHLAAHSSPQRIAFAHGKRDNGVLHLLIDNGSLATELQHLEPLLIERINAFFGYRAVARVRIIQGPLPVAATTPPPPAEHVLDADGEEKLTRHLAAVDDPDLRPALERLGRAIMSAKNG
ncbi:MAG: hypothetical protein A3G18_11745 [Rhodospirillales bacterium RIFCSPLOWO2_12_FULL_58_28]|nr:MAG: hypothetical protein A3H92_11935 [Rhodospirillales bacterium RIFCSPLOWO2_02_FULL_58_16]OHC77492.1 MAG: hypothetical protein A3G18_11745 [Rhodospirillales bacterium RIFCSPLOWO2_12_FULL_58_28]